MVNCISDISSIVTLLVFLMYLGGRLITIFNVKPILKDKIIMNPSPEQVRGYGIVEEYSNGNSEGKTYGMIVAKEGIRNICKRQ